jgi:hypothetical protein
MFMRETLRGSVGGKGEELRALSGDASEIC